MWYRRSASYGALDDQSLFAPQGITASPAGHVLVFDAGNHRVVRLDPTFERSDVIGRAGHGPGEFSFQRVATADWIAAGDTSFFVMDLRSISEFHLDGRFLGHATSQPPMVLQVRRIAQVDGGLAFMQERVDPNAGDRTVETTRLERQPPHRSIREDTVAPLPQLRGRPVRAPLSGQADPLWAARGRCAFLSDGAGDWLLRIDLETGRADTLHLPARPIPVMSRADEEHVQDVIARMGAMGMAPASPDLEPTARAKWRDIAVDPDGFVWLEPWRPWSQRGDPFGAWVVNPASGTVDSVGVGAFPQAFTPDGFVALAFGPDGEPILEKYVASQ